MKKYFFFFFLFIIEYCFSQTCDNYTWAKWTDQGVTQSATAILTSNGQPINMIMTANYDFSFTPTIFNYYVINQFEDPPSNSISPKIDWAKGLGGETKMCFSSPVENPVLMLASLGAYGLTVTLSFSEPYAILYDGGGNLYPDSKSIIGTEGFAIIEFPGKFTCVTIYSDTPETYTNITWGVKTPPKVDFSFNKIGCNSFVFNAFEVDTINIIDSWEWEFGDGNKSNQQSLQHTYTNQGIYNVRLVAKSGTCYDTIYKSINYSLGFDTIINAIICDGSVYDSNGFYEKNEGKYTLTYQDINGCDSNVFLDLKVRKVFDEDIYDSICQNKPYKLHGFNLDTILNSTSHTPNIYRKYISYSDFLCDSIMRTLLLTVHPEYSDTIYSTILCENLPYIANGFNENNEGIYKLPLMTYKGCDSSIYLNLKVIPRQDTIYDTIVCTKDYNKNGFNIFTGEGYYIRKEQNINNIDSIIYHLFLEEFRDDYNDTIKASICEGIRYQENGFDESRPGFHPHPNQDNLITHNGCDSVVMLYLNVFPTYDTTIQASICKGSVYTGNGFDGVSEENPPPLFFKTINGCDSVVKLNLKIIENPKMVILPGNDTTVKDFPVKIEAFCDDCLNYIWNTGDVGKYIYVNSIGRYYVKSNTVCGYVSGSLEILTPEPVLFIPNSFTPLEKGNNIFKVFSEDILDIDLKIFNRWGEVIFKTKDIDYGWDGTFNGSICPQGVYVWKLNYKTKYTGNLIFEKAGRLNLLR